MFDAKLRAIIDAPDAVIDVVFPAQPHAKIAVDFPATGSAGLKITDDGEGNITFVSVGGYKVSDDGEGNISFGN